MKMNYCETCHARMFDKNICPCCEAIGRTMYKQVVPINNESPHIVFNLTFGKEQIKFSSVYIKYKIQSFITPSYAGIIQVNNQRLIDPYATDDKIPVSGSDFEENI